MVIYWGLLDQVGVLSAVITHAVCNSMEHLLGVGTKWWSSGARQIAQPWGSTSKLQVFSVHAAFVPCPSSEQHNLQTQTPSHVISLFLAVLDQSPSPLRHLEIGTHAQQVAAAQWLVLFGLLASYPQHLTKNLHSFCPTQGRSVAELCLH